MDCLRFRVARLSLVALTLSLAATGPAAERMPPKPTPPVGPRLGPFRPGQCAEIDRPLITLTLDPARPCPGETVTLRWQVKDRRRDVAWADPVTLTAPAGLAVDLPRPAGNKGSRSFAAIAGLLHAGGDFTLATRCGTRTLAWEVGMPPLLREVRDLAGEVVTAARLGRLVKLVGRGFGDPPDAQPRVEFLRDGGRPVRLSVINFADSELTVRLGGGADFEPDRGRLEVVAGCRSNQVPFEVLR